MKSAAYERVNQLWNEAQNNGQTGFTVTMKKTGEVFDIKQHNTMMGCESFYVYKNGSVYARGISNLTDLAECLMVIGNPQK